MLAGIAIVGGVLLSGASQGWAQQKAAISKKPLVGTWTLVSRESVSKDGTKERTMEGTNLKGLLIFDANRFSLQVISEYPKLASSDRLKTTPEENKAVAHGVLSYFGTYSVSEAEGGPDVSGRTQFVSKSEWRGLKASHHVSHSGRAEIHYPR